MKPTDRSRHAAGFPAHGPSPRSADPATRPAGPPAGHRPPMSTDVPDGGGPLLTIGAASKRSGVSAKMIRHYESLGLLPPAARSDGGYRLYDGAAVHALRFVRRARDLGFGLAEIESLLRLWADRGRASADVKRIALAHVAELGQRVERMQAMQRTLERLADACHGDDRPDCPILDDLESCAGCGPAVETGPQQAAGAETPAGALSGASGPARPRAARGR